MGFSVSGVLVNARLGHFSLGMENLVGEGAAETVPHQPFSWDLFNDWPPISHYETITMLTRSRQPDILEHVDLEHLWLSTSKSRDWWTLCEGSSGSAATSAMRYRHSSIGCQFLQEKATSKHWTIALNGFMQRLAPSMVGQPAAFAVYTVLLGMSEKRSPWYSPRGR